MSLFKIYLIIFQKTLAMSLHLLSLILFIVSLTSNIINVINKGNGPLEQCFTKIQPSFICLILSSILVTYQFSRRGHSDRVKVQVIPAPTPEIRNDIALNIQPTIQPVINPGNDATLITMLDLLERMDELESEIVAQRRMISDLLITLGVVAGERFQVQEAE